jgi:ParB family transcriptional regulator, chromosome partitioning protein
MYESCNNRTQLNNKQRGAIPALFSYYKLNDMQTAIKSKRNNTKQRKTEQPLMEQGKADNLPINQIGFSPLNYRKYFRQEDLEAFAGELKLHGIISPLTVRKMPSGKFELVAGERRLRAARIAKLPTVPVVVRELTDQQVTEIQLAENLQRENPHPMDEANAVKLMQDTGKPIEEIALRLGKSRQFVYIRLKLLNLIEAVREMFFAEVINIQQALDIATISQEGQTEFFNDHCTKWKQKNFELGNLQWCLRQYKYDLKNAPFNTKDKKLIPEIGACTGCSFNSATLKTLFPEFAKQAVCTDSTCYMNKCTASLRIGFLNALQIHEPAALLFIGEPSEKMQTLLNQISEAADLPRYDFHQITVLASPEEPEKEEYTNDYNEDEPEFDEEGYSAAMQEYKDDLAEHQRNIEGGKFQKALIERNGDFYAVLFSPEPPSRNYHNSNGKGLTMKTVQEALKAGTATPEMLQEAIQGTLQREQRAKQIDRDKVQLNVHAHFEGRIKEIANNESLTDADLGAARLLVYQSLDFNGRRTVQQTLFAGTEDQEENSNEVFYHKLLSLTDQQYSYLIRMAIACKSESKYPHNETGFVLYKVAEAAGINVKAIEQEQEEKAIARNGRTQVRIEELKKKISKLKPTE